MRTPFLEELDKRVLVCDGAMGTMLYARGIFLNRSFDELNLTQPDLVAEVHKEYARAGADVIETNTFGANRVKLGAFASPTACRDQSPGQIADRAADHVRAAPSAARHSHEPWARRARAAEDFPRTGDARCARGASSSC